MCEMQIRGLIKFDKFYYIPDQAALQCLGRIEAFSCFLSSSIQRVREQLMCALCGLTCKLPKQSAQANLEK
jgi:hypothetical protein